MIVPTTILSLAALSAAESNSSGKRGLRKSSTPWTAIAVVSGTALTAGAIGGLLGHFLTAGGGAGHKYPDGVSDIRGTGCKKDYYQPGDGPATDAKDYRSCSPCASDKSKAAESWSSVKTECSARTCTRSAGGTNNATHGKMLTGTQTCTCAAAAGSGAEDTTGTCTVAAPICADTGACTAAAVAVAPASTE